MKKCPQCGTQYSDVTLSFCLQDGTPLVVEPQADTPTVVLGETETVVPRRDAICVPVEGPDSAGWDKSQVTQVAVPSGKKGSNTAIAVLLTVIGMLILFGIIGVAAILFWPRPDQGSVRNANNANIAVSNGNSPTPFTVPSPVQSIHVTSVTPRPSPEVNFPPPPPVLSRYPATTRLKFTRGAYTTSFSGEVNPGDSRSLVLSCRSGQSLSATVTSGASCISFRGGGGSIRTMTNGGDNYLTVTNSCSNVTRFSISITVI